MDARLSLGAVLLRSGRYAEGWPLYEARQHAGQAQNQVSTPEVRYPRWRGESLAGRSLLVVTEQGFGDVIQFCRYLPMLRARGVATLTVACHPALRSLLESSGWVDACVPLDQPSAWPAHDCWCFLMSLPALMQTTLDSIPSAMPYLFADDAKRSRWHARLNEQAGSKPKIGLVWSGEPRPWLADSLSAFSRRWFDASLLAPLLSRTDVTFVSVQKGRMARDQLKRLPDALRPLDPMDEVKDFADTAALVAALDLVITIDSAVAHLAGALGKPVWILLCSHACWRWLDGRDDSPWYPTARLFRQDRSGDWTPPLERTGAALDRWLRP
jgi:hypothetical protein